MTGQLPHEPLVFLEDRRVRAHQLPPGEREEREQKGHLRHLCQGTMDVNLSSHVDREQIDDDGHRHRADRQQNQAQAGA